MRKVIARLGSFLALIGALILLFSSSAFAHETRKEGDHVFVVGWGVEPVVAGFPNTVLVEASHSDGRPVEGATLQAEVLFGNQTSDQKSQAIDLVPSDEAPGTYNGFIIPTRPGTYTFRVFGQLGKGENLDAYFTSGPQTFDDVEDPQGAQFPAKDPTAGQLSEKIDRLDVRLATIQESAVSAARSADDAAGTARLLAIVAIALAVIALGASIVLPIVSRRRPAGP